MKYVFRVKQSFMEKKWEKFIDYITYHLIGNL